MKPIIIAIMFLACSASAKQQINFERLADVIKIHENSIKFPYGCHRKINGKFVGYPEPIARQKCINLCKKVYSNLDGTGNYFQRLNKIYAEDKQWWKSVEKKYNKNKTTK